jgi:hypothetical protein
VLVVLALLPGISVLADAEELDKHRRPARLERGPNGPRYGVIGRLCCRSGEARLRSVSARRPSGAPRPILDTEPTEP